MQDKDVLRNKEYNRYYTLGQSLYMHCVKYRVHLYRIMKHTFICSNCCLCVGRFCYNLLSEKIMLCNRCDRESLVAGWSHAKATMRELLFKQVQLIRLLMDLNHDVIGDIITRLLLANYTPQVIDW